MFLLLLIRYFTSANALPLPITSKTFFLDILWTYPSISFTSLFLLSSSAIFITSFAKQYMTFLMSVLLYFCPMFNKNHTVNVLLLLPSIWGGKVFGCNNVHSLLLTSGTAIDNKKILFQTWKLSLFYKKNQGKW